MINILLLGHDYKYELSEFFKLFSSEFSYLDSSEDFDVIKDINKVLLKKEKYEKLVELFIEKKLYIKNEDNRINIADKIKNVINKIEGDLLINLLCKENTDEGIILRTRTVVYSGYEIIFDNQIEELINEKKFAKNFKKIDNNIKTISKRIIQRSIFDYLYNKFDANVPWGILTGIRPVKIIHSLLDKGMNECEIARFMKKEYLISDEKLDLIVNIAKRERKFIYPLSKDKISLYVSIPFCPTRCLYCSFPSHPLGKFGDLRGQYVNALIKEAVGLNELIQMQGKEIETIYIGGGTPTALEYKDLETLIKALFEIFDLSNIKEFTVEAGRPDSITFEKLKVLKDNNVTRISINPQTMNDSTLKLIGRNHTVDDIKKCFTMARELKFDNINMDLILGLPGETPEMVKHTMDEILKLNPESITVHTLALKRASDLKINVDSYKDELTSYQNMIEMLEISKQSMNYGGYNPYYMYRQKHMLGNLENIGYSKEGYECLYNMQIMEEKQSNYAIGAGAVSKFVYIDENRIERVDDVKNLEIYLERVDEMIDKKVREVEKNANRSSKGD